MLRTVIGAVVGMAVGMLTLAALGAWYGYANGEPAAKLPPGWHAAVLDAVWFCFYFFWIALPAGAVIGGVAGFGSWLVRPHRKTASPAHVRRSRR